MAGPYPARPRGLRGVRSMSSLALRGDVDAASIAPPTFAETMQRYNQYHNMTSLNHNQHENNNDVFTGLAGITTPKKAVIVNRSISTAYPADLSRDSERRRPRPISGTSEISIDWSSNSEEAGSEQGQIEAEEEEDMQGQYASLEQLLARKGFKGGECRVMTPESHKLVTSIINTSDTPKPRTGPVQPPSTSQLPTSSLRAKSSILSLGGLVSSIWNGSITFTPSPSSSSSVDPASQTNVAPPSPAQSGSSSDSDETTAADFSFEKEKEQTVSRWIKAAAASVEMSSSSSASSSSVASSSYTFASGFVGFGRTSMDSTIESIQVETPSTSPKTKNGGKAYIFHTARTQQDDGSMLSFEHKEEGSDDLQEEERTAESLLREAPQALPEPKVAAAKDKRPSLADIFSNTMSEESIKTASASSARTDSPTPPASPSTVIALPRASSSVSPVDCEEVPVSPITAINLADPIAKPAKAAIRTITTTTTTTTATTSSSSSSGPQPKLLRKAKSLHSLRLAASPVLSTQDIVVVQPVREATPPPLPSLPSSSAMPRAPVPRSAKSSSSSTSSSTPKKAEYPRNAAHRNPRDSPIGETRVVKGIPSSASSASPQRARAGGVKGPSILDDLEDDMGLWTPPRKKSTSLRRTIHQNNLANDENTPPPSSSSLGAQARRPKLKAKESLECILSKGRDVEVNKAKQQVIQQTPAGRKALGQLSSFHRNPLPVPKKDIVAAANEGKKKEDTVHAPQPVAQTIVKKSSISSFSGTIKGFFGAATGWAEPSSPPRPVSKPVTTSTKPQSVSFQTQAPHRSSQSPRKNGNTSSRHPSRRQIRSESIYHPDQLQNHSRGRSGEFAYSVSGRDGRNGGRAYQGGQSRSMILPTIVISDASSEYDDGVPL